MVLLPSLTYNKISFTNTILYEGNEFLIRHILVCSIHNNWLANIRHGCRVLDVCRLRGYHTWSSSGVCSNWYLCFRSLYLVRINILSGGCSRFLNNLFQRTCKLLLNTFLFIYYHIIPYFQSQFIFHIVLLLKQHFFLILLAVWACEFLITNLSIVYKFLVFFLSILLARIYLSILIQILVKITVFLIFRIILAKAAYLRLLGIISCIKVVTILWFAWLTVHFFINIGLHLILFFLFDFLLIDS